MSKPSEHILHIRPRSVRCSCGRTFKHPAGIKLSLYNANQHRTKELRPDAGQKKESRRRYLSTWKNAEEAALRELRRRHHPEYLDLLEMEKGKRGLAADQIALERAQRAPLPAAPPEVVDEVAPALYVPPPPMLTPAEVAEPIGVDDPDPMARPTRTNRARLAS